MEPVTDVRTPLILDVKGNSLDDGPGIRSVVFFKGCPLSCLWCHNPESKKTGPEIAFDRGRCVDCGDCRQVCPEKALSRQNPLVLDRNRCTLCFVCLQACPSGALERVGQEMSIEEILEKILPDKPFFEASGGGVTLSGGEPTLFMDFAGKLLEALKGQNIHTLLETCGQFDMDRFMALLYPHLDAVYFDIKLMDQMAHKAYCGVSNHKILDNFSQLFKTAKKDGKRVLPRTPLVPGITDTEKNLSDIAAFLKELNVTQAALLAYNPLWHDKTEKIGAISPYQTDKAMGTFSESIVLEKSREIFSREGILTQASS